jgi:hypothetical protein
MAASADDFLRQVVARAEFRSGFDIDAQPAEVRSAVAGRPFADAYGALAALVGRVPATGLLLPVFNATGEMRIGTVVAAGVLAEIDAGTLDPAGDPDAVVAAVAAGLDDVLGRERRQELLDGLVVETSPGVSGETGTVFVDGALARVALRPIVDGTAESVPERPGAMSAAFDWDRWVRVASSSRSGDGVAPADRPIAADLLASSGRASDAARMLAGADDPGAAAGVAHRHMLRLDDGCVNALRHPFAMNPPLYRFPPG